MRGSSSLWGRRLGSVTHGALPPRGWHETDNDGEEFGIFAGTPGKFGIEAWKLGPLGLPFEDGDFVVRDV